VTRLLSQALAKSVANGTGPRHFPKDTSSENGLRLAASAGAVRAGDAHATRHPSCGCSDLVADR
jgi:hypothetical protein